MECIKNFLSETGWSYEELVQKLDEFKKLTASNADSSSSGALHQLNSAEKNEISSDKQHQEVCYSDSQNVEFSGNDHNYIKQTCNDVCDTEQCNNVNKSETHVNLLEDNNINNSECSKDVFAKYNNKAKRKPFGFRHNFLYRIRRSYRKRCLHKNVQRLLLIPKQSRRNFEGVRSQILLQLELLRAKRSSDFGRNINQTITSDHLEPVLYKKRLSNDKRNETATIHETDVAQIESMCVDETTTEALAASLESLINTEVPTTETAISSHKSVFNVENQTAKTSSTSFSGTISSDGPKIEAEVLSASAVSHTENGRKEDINNDIFIPQKLDNYEENSNNKLNSHIIKKPTKTKDIRKIKGWRHKNFVAEEVLGASNSYDFSSDISQPSCSYAYKPNADQVLHQNVTNENVTDSTNINQETNVSAKSAFSSNNLDGFLHESSDLQISFQIPKLASGEDCVNTVPINPVTVTQKEPDEEEKNSYEDIESEILNDDRENLLKIHKITNLYKPRTVGQRKRIWRLRNDSKTTKQEDNLRKPRTLAEKRRLLDENEESKNLIPAKRSASETNFHNEDLKYSYVLYRGRKIKVPTVTENDIVAYIKYSYSKKEYVYVSKKRTISPSKNKPSIFNCNNALKSNVVKYKPGPLCKKLQLQEENKIWKTVIKKLPQIYLEITPEIKKSIHPKLWHFLPDFQFEISDQRIEFALSVLYDKNGLNNKRNNGFTFPVAYANHEESMLFLQKITENTESVIEKDGEQLMMDVVKDVVNKMLDYVETKEIANEIFKEDINIRCRDEEIPANSEAAVNTKKRIKKSKTNYELRRLNVKVIEVDLEDKGDIINCNNDYCKLGCVCKSLATTSSLVSNHCGLPECMFKCTCNYEKKNRGTLKVTLPIGIDVLSEGAVSRLEDEAKKNLAKVEKEFTQTVIQANNQTIVVGGHSNRQRRLTKAPRKYNDFIDDPDFILQDQSLFEENDDSVEEVNLCDQIEWKPCIVKIPKLKLDQLIPFCLVHNLHNCHCNYTAEYKPPLTEFKINTVEYKQPPLAIENKIKIVNLSDYMRKVADDEYVPSKHYINNIDCQTTARTRGISTSYYLIRNRTKEYLSTRRKKLDKLYKEYLQNVSTELFNERLETVENDEDVQVLSDEEENKSKQEGEKNDVEDKQTIRKARRKQQLTVRDDVILQPIKLPEPKPKQPTAVEILKKTLKPKRKSKLSRKSLKKLKLANKDTAITTTNVKKIDEHKKKNADKSLKNHLATTSNTNNVVKDSIRNLNNTVKDSTLPKFEDLLLSMKPANELLTPSIAVRQKFLQLLGKKSECDAQFRLMPWTSLAAKYETNKLQFWYSSFYKRPKIIATQSFVIPNNFKNIKDLENIEDKSLIKIDLIRWLVTKTVPGGKRGDDVLVILQLNKTHWEVCGICEKTYINSQSSDNMLLSLIPSSVTENNISEKKKDKSVEQNNKTFNFEILDDNRKQHVIARKIMFSKCRYPEAVLEIDTTSVKEIIEKRIIIANLPYINKNSKWRMIHLNSDFSILSLMRNSYAIKYSDLLRIVRMAQTTGATVVLKTADVEQNYSHKDFGIYAAPNCDEKIFIGPYFNNENHDISTLRYVNRVLVKTEIFNQMKGKPPTNSGYWLMQLRGQQVEQKDLQTIDLTLGDSDSETELIETENHKSTAEYVPSIRVHLRSDKDDEQNQKSAEIAPPTSNSLLSFYLRSDKEQQPTTTVINPIEKNLEEPLPEKNVFSIDDVTNYEMSAVDFEDSDNSKDCVVEDNNIISTCTFENQLYFVSNVPLMGYILAHKLGNIIIVRWPTLNNAKRFYMIEEAVSWLERELSEYFIVPSNFKIKIRAKTDLILSTCEPFDPKFLKSYYLATSYGIKSLLNITPQMLQLLGVTSEELETLARKRAKKMIYDKCCDIAKQFVSTDMLKAKSCSEVIDMITSEVKLQRRTEENFVSKQQKLLTRKNELVNNLSSVIKDISPFVSNRTQSAMLDILNNHKTPKKLDTSSAQNDVVCITIDSDEEMPAETIEIEKSQPLKTAEPLATILPKISVKSLSDLTDTNTKTTPDVSKVPPLTALSDVPKAIRLKGFKMVINQENANNTTTVKPVSDLKGPESVLLKANTNINFDTKLEKINLFPALKTSSKHPKSSKNNSRVTIKKPVNIAPKPVHVTKNVNIALSPAEMNKNINTIPNPVDVKKIQVSNYVDVKKNVSIALSPAEVNKNVNVTQNAIDIKKIQGSNYVDVKRNVTIALSPAEVNKTINVAGSPVDVKKTQHSNYVIKTATGKIIRVNAEQLKSVQSKSIFIGPLKNASSIEGNTENMVNNFSAIGEIIKINLDDNTI